MTRGQAIKYLASSGMTEEQIAEIVTAIERAETHECDYGKKETHGDVISRQAAIDTLHMDTSIIPYKKAKEYADATIEEIRNRIKALPSAEPEQRWIPVSERLPKKDGRYQVTRYDYVTNTEFIDILWYEDNLWWDRHSTGDYAVTAWMPLPEPYKASPTGEDSACGSCLAPCTVDKCQECKKDWTKCGTCPVMMKWVKENRKKENE